MYQGIFKIISTESSSLDVVQSWILDAIQAIYWTSKIMYVLWMKATEHMFLWTVCTYICGKIVLSVDIPVMLW